MNALFTLKFLQDHLGEENVKLNPITGNPLLALEGNSVWEAVVEQGGVARVAKSFNLSELMVWKWIDDHYIPDLYAHDLAWPCGLEVADVQRPSIGYQHAATGDCWPWSWKMTVTDNAFQENLGQHRSQQQRGRLAAC